MKITFDTAPIYDAKIACVRFAGRFHDAGGEKFAICRVTREYLLRTGNLTDPDVAKLLEAYFAMSSIIHELAVKQIRDGIYKPVIDLNDSD